MKIYIYSRNLYRITLRISIETVEDGLYMIDKNGREIVTGDIVKIDGAYFKNDNRLYFVKHSPGDINWDGTYHSLHKISKRGKISTAKYHLCSWPISPTINCHAKMASANKWNVEHAEIEIIYNVPFQEVKMYFEKKAAESQAYIDDYHMRGYDDLEYKERECKAFFDKIVANLAKRIQ